MPIPQAELNTPPATMSVEYNDEGIKILTLQNTVTILVFFSKKKHLQLLTLVTLTNNLETSTYVDILSCNFKWTFLGKRFCYKLVIKVFQRTFSSPLCCFFLHFFPWLPLNPRSILTSSKSNLTFTDMLQKTFLGKKSCFWIPPFVKKML